MAKFLLLSLKNTVDLKEEDVQNIFQIIFISLWLLQILSGKMEFEVASTPQCYGVCTSH